MADLVTAQSAAPRAVPQAGPPRPGDVIDLRDGGPAVIDLRAQPGRAHRSTVLSARRRRGVDGACWAATAALAALGAAAATGLDRPLPLVWVMSAAPLALVPAVLLLATAVLRRRPALTAAVVLVAAVHVALVAPAIGLPAPRPAAGPGADGAGRLRVVTANLYFGNRRVEEAGRRLAAADADIVLLQELTPSHAEALRPLLDAYRYRFVASAEGAFGFAILSRFPMVEAERALVAGHPLVRARLSVGGEEIRVWNVHPPAPRDAAAGRVWDGHLRELGRQASAAAGPLVVAGDFNATWWVPQLADLLAAGLSDTHTAGGRGLAATWPADRALPPFLLLDRVLVSTSVGVVSVAELEAGGSDHRPVVADLTLPRPRPLAARGVPAPG